MLPWFHVVLIINITAQTREVKSCSLVRVVCLVSVCLSKCAHIVPPGQNPLNKQCVSWCLTVCTAHAPLMSIHPGLAVAPLRSLTYSLAHSILPSCSNWHLVQRQADRGPLCPAPPEMWPSCQPSNPVQPPSEPGKNSRLLPLILTPRGTANSPPQHYTQQARRGALC